MKIGLLLCLVLSVGWVHAQKSKIEGQWLVTKVGIDGKIQEPYFITHFQADGKMLIMGIEMGTWQYNKRSNSIEMKSEMDKDFNGIMHILKINIEELVTDKDGTKVFYSKIAEKKIAKDNAKSKLDGLWRFSGNSIPKFIKFELPNSYTLVEKDENSTTTLRGTWIFNPNDKTLLLIGLSNMLKGKSLIQSLRLNTLTLQHKNDIIKLTKEIDRSNKIDRLTFDEKDFYDAEGSYLYSEDEQKLPWYQLPVYGIQNTYAGINKVCYEFKKLIPETQTFETKDLTANLNVNFNNDKLNISFDYIFYGYDHYNLPDDTELPPNFFDAYNPLFPYNDMSIFRVIGKESIDTKIGKYDCTIIEGIDSFNERIMLWMIDDMPGIYAKIVQDKSGDFGYYHVFKIKSIEKKTGLTIAQ